MGRDWLDHIPGYQTLGHRLGLTAITLLILGGLGGPGGLPAQAQRTTRFDLNQAICASDWETAIDITGVLIASEQTTSADRQSLLTLRRQLEYYRADQAIISSSQACDLTDPYLLTAAPEAHTGPAEPLGWEVAVAEVTDNQYSTELITVTPELTLPLSMDDQLGLTPAQPVDLTRGLNVVSGHVGAGHEVYGFVAGMGDRIDINVDVTRVMTGSLYTSDDSQLFIFDHNRRLIAASDDEGEGNQSMISGWIVPETNLYFAVVTSYNNDPIFNQDNQLSGWQDNGGGRFDYTLSITGATPTSALVR